MNPRQRTTSGPESDAAGATARALVSWGHTARLITIAAVLIGLVVGGISLLNVNVTVGPVHITGR